jgi:ribonuclease HII
MNSRKKDKSAVTDALYDYDRAARNECHGVIVGIDEVGRGPLAGPVMAAAVILDPDFIIPGINDSKKLSAAARERCYDLIAAEAIAHEVGSASVEEIDRLNILQATFLAMQRALDSISQPWTMALVDGNQLLPVIPHERQRAVVRGDAQSASIAAASIIAKVTRDRLMKDYHKRFPMYDFSGNKGYGTVLHRARIIEHGLCAIHRRSFCEGITAQTRGVHSRPNPILTETREGT